MKNINFKYLYRRTEQLLMVPETVWPEALNETNSGKELYRNYYGYLDNGSVDQFDQL